VYDWQVGPLGVNRMSPVATNSLLPPPSLLCASMQVERLEQLLDQVVGAATEEAYADALGVSVLGDGARSPHIHASFTVPLEDVAGQRGTRRILNRTRRGSVIDTRLIPQHGRLTFLSTYRSRHRYPFDREAGTRVSKVRSDTSTI